MCRVRLCPFVIPPPPAFSRVCCRVRAASTHAGAPGHMFVNMDVRAQLASGGLLKQVGGFQAQVVFRQAGTQVVALDVAIAPRVDVQGVRPVDQHEHGLQQVVAVGSTSDNVQKQIQLGRCQQVMKRCHGGGSAVKPDADGHAAKGV